MKKENHSIMLKKKNKSQKKTIGELKNSLWYGWVDIFMEKCKNRELTNEDLPIINKEESSIYLHKKVSKIWNVVNKTPESEIKKILRLYWALIKMDKMMIIIELLNKLFLTYMNLYKSQLLFLTMKRFKDLKGDEPIQIRIQTVGMPIIFYYFIMVLYTLIELVSGYYSQKFSNILTKGFEAIGIEKILKLPLLRDKNFGIAQSNIYDNTHILINLKNQILFLCTNPLSAFWKVQWLYTLIGWITFPALIFYFCFNFFYRKINKFLQKYQAYHIQQNYQNINMILEVINNIRYIKENALENHYLSKIIESKKKVSRKSLKVLFMEFMQNNEGSFNSALFLALVLFFKLRQGQGIEIEILFSLLDAYFSAGMSLSSLLMLDFRFENSQEKKEYFEFLNKEEIDLSFMETEKKEEDPICIKIENGEFSWNQIEKKKSEENFVLKNINFEIKKGEKVAIIGKVGSGKTSLFQSLLGETYHSENTRAKINGDLAYVAQKPWIPSLTIKEVILFGEEENEKRYKKALKCSCLEQDLQIMEQGDQTILGERGINLSGGQRMRLSLARAFYSNRDIFLLDDPISALDIHVGKIVMEEGILGYLKNKTVIVNTHAVSYLKYFTRVIIMDKGKIVETGTYDKISKTESFKEILKSLNIEEKTGQTKNLTKKDSEDKIKIDEKENKKNLPETEKEKIEKDIKSPTNIFLEETYIQTRPSLQLIKELLSKVSSTFVKNLIIMLIIENSFQSLTTVIDPIISKYWGTHQKQQISQPILFIFTYFLTQLLRNSSYFFTTNIKTYFSTFGEETFRNRAIFRLLHASVPKYFDRVPSWKIYNKVSSATTGLLMRVKEDISNVIKQM